MDWQMMELLDEYNRVSKLLTTKKNEFINNDIFVAPDLTKEQIDFFNT